MRAHVEGLKRRGIDAVAIDLPVRTAEDVVPTFRTIVPDAPSTGDPPIAVGGQSYGGGVATYPLHPPGRPEQAAPRSSHWPSIRCPVLLLSGESDPFARIELLRAAVPLLRDAELHTYPKLGHTLKPVLDDALDRAAAFLKRVGG
jgi:predicted alpha/beta-hydrolase family hydrolase